MSYILDALRKSDIERRQHIRANVQSNHAVLPADTSPLKTAPKSRNALYFIPLLLIFAASLMWYLRSDTAPPDAPPVTQSQYMPQTPDSQVVARQPDETEIIPVPKSSKSYPINSKKFIKPPGKTIPKPLAQVVIQPLPITDSGEPIPIRHFVSPVPDDAIGYFRELPESIKTQIPNLAFAGHTYAKEPQRRMIMINNRIFHEGDRLYRKLTLREITWEGVVLEFDKEVFRVRTH